MAKVLLVLFFYCFSLLAQSKEVLFLTKKEYMLFKKNPSMIYDVLQKKKSGIAIKKKKGSFPTVEQFNAQNVEKQLKAAKKVQKNEKKEVIEMLDLDAEYKKIIAEKTSVKKVIPTPKIVKKVVPKPKLQKKKKFFIKKRVKSYSPVEFLEQYIGLVRNESVRKTSLLNEQKSFLNKIDSSKYDIVEIKSIFNAINNAQIEKYEALVILNELLEVVK